MINLVQLCCPCGDVSQLVQLLWLCADVLRLVQDGELMVVDPSLEEEAAAEGLMTVIMNAFGELCAVQKTSGIALPSAEVSIEPTSRGGASSGLV